MPIKINVWFVRMILWRLPCTPSLCLGIVNRRLVWQTIRCHSLTCNHNNCFKLLLYLLHCVGQIHETVEQINAIKLQREFYLGFADNPQKFINDWLASQNRDLKVQVVWSPWHPHTMTNESCTLSTIGNEGSDGQHRGREESLLLWTSLVSRSHT